jgi:membrane-associated phospholipid phosphatase
MNPIDAHAIAFLNQFANRSEAFDAFVHAMGSNYLLKTGLIMTLLYWVWFREVGKNRDHRETLVFGLTASCIAVLVARALSFALPFRERPLRNPDLHFVLPHTVGLKAIEGWSSFPSDNATLFFGIASCIFLVSRRAGILAFCHTLFVVAFARVYLGYHYPSDIVGGAIIGIGAVSLVRVPALRIAVTRLPMRWLRRHPQSFQTAICVLVFMIATTFEPLYPLAHVALGATSAIVDWLGEEPASWIVGAVALLLLVAGVWALIWRLHGARPRSAPPTDRRHASHTSVRH